MSKPWVNTLNYLLTKRYVVWSFRQFFSKVIIKGEKKLPKEGSVIFAPNHLNALMDALAVLSLPPHRMPKVFLARADLFKLPPIVVKFLRFAKILPAYRIRDGFDQLDRNKETFDEAELSLLNNASLGIMPEGNQGEERNIRPLVKGIFRIAFSTQQKMPVGKSVKIVPIGLEYQNIREYQRTLIINIGHAIDVKDYMPLYAENPAKATNELKSTLRNALESLTVHLPTGEDYQLFDEVTELVSPALHKKRKPWHLFKSRREVAERLQNIAVNYPEKLEELKRLHTEYNELAVRLNFPVRPAEHRWKPKQSKLKMIGQLILQFILMLPGAMLNYFPYRLITSLPRLVGIEYSGFFGSVYYVAGIVLLPLYYLLIAILIAVFTPLPFLLMLALTPLMYLSGKLSFRCYQRIRDLRNDLRVVQLRRIQPRLFDSLVTIRQKIIDLVVYVQF